MTETERRVWSRLRNRQVHGYKFRRQVPVGPYFVDFLCWSDRLAVEVDGPLHDDRTDKLKDEYLKAQGFRVFRVPVGDVDDSVPASPLRGEAIPLRGEAVTAQDLQAISCNAHELPSGSRK